MHKHPTGLEATPNLVPLIVGALEKGNWLRSQDFKFFFFLLAVASLDIGKNRGDQGRGGRVFLLPGLVTTQEVKRKCRRKRQGNENAACVDRSSCWATIPWWLLLPGQARPGAPGHPNLLQALLRAAGGSHRAERCLVSLKSGASLLLTSRRPLSRQDT